MNPAAKAPVHSVNNWATNGHLIADVQKLGYIPFPAVDLTPGRGVWWKQLENPDVTPSPYNFLHLPYADGQFATVAYDPPYVSMGGRATSKLPDFMDRYGLTEAPTSPKELQENLINPGLTEAARISSRYVLVKVKDYISSGKLWRGVYETQRHADEIGLIEIDWFEMWGRPGPQPPNRRQVHARKNSSRLIVFKK